MPKQGEATRQYIIEQAAQVFNARGYSGTTIADLMRATDLEKGGIYRHFGSKEEVAAAALDYNLGQTARFIQAEAAKVGHAADKLRAMVNAFHQIFSQQRYHGGCPMQNTAVEGEAAPARLLDMARQAMTDLRDAIHHGIRRGVERGEIQPGIDPEEMTAVFIAALEGGLMLSQLYEDDIHLERVVHYLHHVIDRSLDTRKP